VSPDPALWNINNPKELESGGARNRKAQIHEIIKVVREGGHLAEDLLVQGLNTLKVLWRSVLEFPETSKVKKVKTEVLREV
jgi:hypothetical protein